MFETAFDLAFYCLIASYVVLFIYGTYKLVGRI